MPYKDREQQLEAQRQNYRDNKDRYNRQSKDYQDKKRALIIEAKNKSCADCKKYWPYYVMQFDHVRGEKKFVLATAHKHFGFDAIEEEIKKCYVVCANCHMIRSWKTGAYGN